MGVREGQTKERIAKRTVRSWLVECCAKLQKQDTAALTRVCANVEMMNYVSIGPHDRIRQESHALFNRPGRIHLDTQQATPRSGRLKLGTFQNTHKTSTG